MSNIESLSKPVDAATWKKLFPKDSEQNPPSLEAGKFELGLVLGGTVSAGAYTAGVLDYLVEALDNWEAQKSNNVPSIPNWEVTIKTMSGTSGGGVLAATLAKALSWDFPHVSSRPPTPAINNPFYHVWVESLDIKDMLSNDDLERDGNIQSLLNSNCRFKAGEYVANFPQTTLPKKRRSYVAEPLTAFLTLTNLRGIPYTVDWGNGLAQSYVSHADHVRLAVFTKDGNSPVRPDEFGVSANPLSGYVSWDSVSKFALGTSAFPIGLPLQPLSRPIDQYRYRPIVVPSDGTSPADIQQPNIDWRMLVTEGQTDVDLTYHFTVADGGVMNNEPIELCRRHLAGVVGRNPRDGDKANRAVLLVDPFADAPNLGKNATDLGNAMNSLFSSLKDQARYDTQDMLLATHADCYSRFMITAKRGNIVGGKAIATASLGAFGGFLCKEYREHDYFLGRKNCQEFLENPDNFWLPETNPLFGNWRQSNPNAANTLRRQNISGDWCLPIIPLFGSSLLVQNVPVYPHGRFDPKSLEFQYPLNNRVDKLLSKANHEFVPDFITRIYIQFGESIAGKSKLIRTITQSITEGLAKWDLL